MWNGIFDNAEGIEYPEKLRSILISIRPSIDIVLPGLEASMSIESGAQQHSFVESQDDLEVLNMSSAMSARQEEMQRMSSTQSSSPAVVNISLSAKRQRNSTPDAKSAANQRRTTPRLRHDDSQIHFAPIESSPALDQEESQLLTERQREVRDRQRESTAMFPDLRSSPRIRNPARLATSPSPVQKRLAEKQRESTPKPESYEDVFSSTPTPRRGQTITMDDHEMTDPPSSPPEPRRFPLLSEIKSRSSSTSSRLEMDWELSSSPISGSPLPSHQALSTNEPPELSLAGEGSQSREDPQNNAQAEVLAEDSFNMEVISSSVPSDAQLLPDLATEKDSPVKTLRSGRTTAVRGIHPLPATPRRLRSRPLVDETPKSDNDIFVDALTSPHPPSEAVPTSCLDLVVPVVVEHLIPSFEFSEGDESSILRRMEELVSKPEKPRAGTGKSKTPEKAKVDEVPALDCITVFVPEKLRDEVADDNSISPATPSASKVEDNAPAKSAAGSKKKRKRGSMVVSTRRKKRRSVEKADDIERVGESQSSIEDGISPTDDTPPEELAVARDEVTEELQIYIERDTLSSSAELPTQEAFENAAQPIQAAESEYKSDHNTDEELESQLRADSESASLSGSQADEQTGASFIIDDSREIDLPELNTQEEAASADLMGQEEAPIDPRSSTVLKESSPAAETPSVVNEPATADDIIATFQVTMDKLRTATLSHAEVRKIEDLFFDVKVELYAARKRGVEN
jgi:hypothetical protein